MSNIQIIDIGLGNISSIINMLKKVGYQSERIHSPEYSDNLNVLILPGVGSYDFAMNKLNEGGWVDFIKQMAGKNNVTILGICLGMQLLCDGSEEGNSEGLSLIPGYFKKFPYDRSTSNLKVPHMGWNTVQFMENGKFLLDEPDESHRYYFVHSYHYSHETSDYELGKTTYGLEYASAIRNKNVYGFQFHPEKSHRFGMELLKNFMDRAC